MNMRLESAGVSLVVLHAPANRDNVEREKMWPKSLDEDR